MSESDPNKQSKDPWGTGYNEDRFARTRRDFQAEDDGTPPPSTTNRQRTPPPPLTSATGTQQDSKQRSQQRQAPRKKSVLEQEFYLASAKVGAGYILGGVFGLVFNAAGRTFPALPRPKPTIVYANSVAQAGVGIAIIDILIRHLVGGLFGGGDKKKN